MLLRRVPHVSRINVRFAFAIKNETTAVHLSRRMTPRISQFSSNGNRFATQPPSFFFSFFLQKKILRSARARALRRSVSRFYALLQFYLVVPRRAALFSFGRICMKRAPANIDFSRAKALSRRLKFRYFILSGGEARGGGRWLTSFFPRDSFGNPRAPRCAVSPNFALVFISPLLLAPAEKRRR